MHTRVAQKDYSIMKQKSDTYALGAKGQIENTLSTDINKTENLLGSLSYFLDKHCISNSQIYDIIFAKNINQIIFLSLLRQKLLKTNKEVSR